MTRPQIIRADTIDLQDVDAPSAKDHTRQPTHPSPLGAGPPSPHQAGALRRAEDDSIEQKQHSPSASQDFNSTDIHHQNSIGTHSEGEAGHAQQNGGLNGAQGEDGELADSEGDDGLDDDMLDKISSSPSIDDGGSKLPIYWPLRKDSLSSCSSPSTPSSARQMMELSSSPFLSTPLHFPLCSHQDGVVEDQASHHQTTGLYKAKLIQIGHANGDKDDFEDEDRDLVGPLLSEQDPGYFNPQEQYERPHSPYDASFEVNQFYNLLLPASDHLLDGIDQEGGIREQELARSSYDWDSIFDGLPVPEELPAFEDDDDCFDDPGSPDDELFFPDDLRYVATGWGGDCLRELEDIDFEFVYALHTFVATVEGQANATKGDTMVLLDDSNSYWWLVRVVKDSSIGYLPAEHIETPTERLARLNKHRNIDLSATMLSDNAEKSKNPLKKAIRRRNAKTVQFAAPTYYEAAEIDYSSSEEDGEGESPSTDDHAGEDEESQKDDRDEITAVEPLKVRAPGKERGNEAGGKLDQASATAEAEARVAPDVQQSAEDDADAQVAAAERKTKAGTVRNTDSFFGDSTQETRKISLTPKLLSDDSSNASTKSTDSKEPVKSRGSIEASEKVASPVEKSKEDKKKKEKKPGMLSGLFKRSKEKKNKAQDEEADDGAFSEKLSGDSARSSPVQKTSEDSSPMETQAPLSVISPQAPNRQPSKLQKPPPLDISTSKPASQPLVREVQPPTVQAPDRPAPTIEQATTMRAVEPGYEDQDRPAPLRIQTGSRSGGGESTPEPKKEAKEGMFSPITNMLRSSSNSEPKPEKVKKAKKRVELDEFDSSPDTEESPEPMARRQGPGSGPSEPVHHTDPLSESPVHVSASEAQPSHPPPLMVDSSSQEEASVSPVSPSSSPELVDRPDAHDDKMDTPNSTAESSTPTPTWSDASLRAYLEDSSEIRDLLIVVHDKSGVVPAGPDHPLISGLFKEEKVQLANMQTRLDGLLNDFLARKARTARR